ncbi:hypothetical protein Syun_007087 [Stephania yunnanensis]|uniref:Uncharacterized protein n=1 Tax=Stephania yunnanensis TaxID=152371 RepID=A0AAP0KY08_9MAGN
MDSHHDWNMNFITTYEVALIYWILQVADQGGRRLTFSFELTEDSSCYFSSFTLKLRLHNYCIPLSQRQEKKFPQILDPLRNNLLTLMKGESGRETELKLMQKTLTCIQKLNNSDFFATFLQQMEASEVRHRFPQFI